MSSLVKRVLIATGVAISGFITISVLSKVVINQSEWLAISIGGSVGVTVAYVFRDIDEKEDFISVSGLLLGILSIFLIPAFLCGVFANETLGSVVVSILNCLLSFAIYYWIDLIASSVKKKVLKNQSQKF